MKYEDIERFCPICGAKMIFIGWDSTNTVCMHRCPKCKAVVGD